MADEWRIKYQNPLNGNIVSLDPFNPEDLREIKRTYTKIARAFQREEISPEDFYAIRDRMQVEYGFNPNTEFEKENPELNGPGLIAFLRDVMDFHSSASD